MRGRDLGSWVPRNSKEKIFKAFGHVGSRCILGFGERGLVVSVLSALVLATLSLPAAQAQTPARRAIRSLLADRAEAVRDQNATRFKETLRDPRSAYGRAASRSFRNLTELPVARYALVPAFDSLGDLARPSDEARYPGADEVRTYLVQERYAFERYDERAVHQDLYLTFLRHGDEWSVASDSDLEDVGLYSQRNIWDFGAPEVSQSENLLGLGAPGTALAPLLSVAEEARRLVNQRWKRPWSGRTVITQPGDAAEIARIIQATYDVAPYVAFAFWTGGAKGYPGARIIAEPSAFAAASRERALSILVHEMFHVAALPSSGSSMPHFIDEGYAQWVQYADEPLTLASAAAHRGELPQNHEFFIGSPTEIFATYQESLSAVTYLIQRWGTRRAERLYVRIGKSSGPGTSEWHVDRAFRRVLGLSLHEFEEAWASSI